MDCTHWIGLFIDCGPLRMRNSSFVFLYQNKKAVFPCFYPGATLIIILIYKTISVAQ